MLTPKNWTTFQHYHDRRPPWIKLHKSLLDDVDYLCLPDASKALAPFLWLLASEYQGGEITLTLPKLAIRLRMSEEKLMEGLKPLIDEGFFIASEVLAEVEQSARLDRGEGETEKEKDIPSADAPVKPKREPKARTLGDWPEELDQAMSTWRDLRRGLLSEEILAKFPNDPEGRYVAQVGTKGKAWEAWKKRRGVVTPSGVRVTDAHILGAVVLWADAKRHNATTGKTLAMPNLSSLINSADFEDALLRVVEVPHAS